MSQDLHASELSEYTENSEKFGKLAKSSVDKFSEISSIAKEKLERYRSTGMENVFASPGDENRASGSLRTISTTIQDEYLRLSQEPAIARIVIQYTNTKEIQVFYVCRCAPPSGVKDVLSYRSPMGRLVALEVGKTYDLGEETRIRKYDEQDISKVQHATFIPVRKGERWDSRKTEYRDAKSKHSIKIGSLLKLLESTAEDGGDILTILLAEESKKDNITHVLRRDIVETLSLRDQPILDQYQDDIFRLPLQSSLLLLGPAGSGKTTTLIRRLGQKLDREHGLVDDERRLVENLVDVNKPHETSWLMFTPTELLKSYLQEAFNLERIPAPDRNITTWEIYKYQLGKDVFKILYTSNFESGFQYDPDVLTLIDGAADSINIYKDFYAWLIADYAKDIISVLKSRENVEKLKNDQTLALIFELVQNYLQDGKSISYFFREILKYKSEISKLYDITKKEIDFLVDQELNMELKAYPKFLNELSSFIKLLSQGEDESADEQDDAVADVFEDEEEFFSTSDLKKARVEYRRILLILSQKTSDTSKKTKSPRSTAMLEWLGERKPSEQALSSLRILAAEARILNSLSKPLNKFFRAINTKYRKFRRLRQSENKWYNPDSALRKKIDATELDILILANLTVSHDLLSSTDIYRDTSASWLSILEPVKNYYVNQVLVDEAPDFSPLQISCMKLLSHPQVNSFFACGDFNQRLTSAGTKNFEDLQTILPGKEVIIRKICTPYRQSKKLYGFSLNVLQMINKVVTGSIEGKAEGSVEGFLPVLGEHLKDTHLARWIAERIIEIERLLGTIPSIAILVPGEDYVRPVAQELQTALSRKTSAIVQACHEGQARGSEKAVRVFDIKHIKGLEFEAAFFVALDRLESLYPDLLGNYLYVGATRAATFLGVSYEDVLPKPVETCLRQCFVNAWQLPD